ncbi:substrate-binding periplasmic protein [Paractinoplanes maris]|uniref:substrate-binding periplasmic protein n=1 Tax=Paractinoplanes maris TaxID=1734446 RepID=UPI0020226E2E|nr:transporter substrate-binding domain-containing protein [Actinoplanes maris]
MRRGTAVLILLMVVLGACGLPRDTSSTLADVRGGVLHVGVTENPPWVTVPDEGPPTGAEITLVTRLADRLGARVEWHPGSESELMAAVKGRVLDLVVGGLAADAPWTEEASLTRPYVTMRTLVAAPAGVRVPDDLTGQRVAVPGGTADVAALVGEGATVVAVDEVTGREQLPVVVGEWRLTELGLTPSKHELGATDHVWALPPGENAWQSEVEHFLLKLSHDDVVRVLVDAERTEAAR